MSFGDNTFTSSPSRTGERQKELNALAKQKTAQQEEEDRLRRRRSGSLLSGAGNAVSDVTVGAPTLLGG